MKFGKKIFVLLKFVQFVIGYVCAWLVFYHHKNAAIEKKSIAEELYYVIIISMVIHTFLILFTYLVSPSYVQSIEKTFLEYIFHACGVAARFIAFLCLIITTLKHETEPNMQIRPVKIMSLEMYNAYIAAGVLCLVNAGLHCFCIAYLIFAKQED